MVLKYRRASKVQREKLNEAVHFALEKLNDSVHIAKANRMVQFTEIPMKNLVLALSLLTLTASSALAGGISFDLPRVSFPDQGAEVTQSCNLLTQTCTE